MDVKDNSVPDASKTSTGAISSDARDTVDITGVPVDRITMGQALEKVKGFLAGDKACTIYTPNAEFMMKAKRDPEFRHILSCADLCIPDGSGVVLASKLLGDPLPEKVAGFDLACNIFKLCSCSKNAGFYFLGGKPGIAEEAAANVTMQNPGVEIAGYRDGYFKPEDEDGIIDEINRLSPDVLLVALSQVKQEKFIHKYKEKLNVKVCMGVGGTLDVLAGRVCLAPDFYRRHGLEWLYRLYRQPSRFKRMLDLPKFVLLVIGIRLKFVKKY